VAAAGLVVAAGVGAVRMLPGGGAEPGKRQTLEGLRGVLALSVMAHHLLTMRAYAATGHWGEPRGNFDNLIGKGAVAVFFMLSAYLFCGAVIARRGRLTAPAEPGSWLARVPESVRFLIGRARRIMPAYLFTVLVLVLMVGVETGFTLREPVGHVLGEIGWWMLLGWHPLDINGFAGTWKMFSVTWSLQTEVQFYLIVPVLALGAKRFGRFAPAVLLAIPAWYYSWWPMFAAGALAVPIVQARFGAWRWPAIAGLGVLIWKYHSATGWVAAGLLLPAFVGAAKGGRGFGWLGSAPMVRLGQVSYSLYLLHNPVIYAMGVWVVGRDRLGTMGTSGFLMLCVATSIVAVVAAAIVQHLVERPFMTRHKTNADHHDRASKPAGARSDAATVTKELRRWPI
jgi:peptidoglycan/LPS O-acetylase OafA/YrhL